MAAGVFGVAIRSLTIPGFGNYIRSLNPSHRPHDEFLREFWEKEFKCSPGLTSVSSYASKPCSGTETLEEVQNHFTDTSKLRVTYNVYLAVYVAAHALHSLLSCPYTDSISENENSTCSFPTDIKPIEVSNIASTPKFPCIPFFKSYICSRDIKNLQFPLKLD